jgi:hypothetical protein
MTVGGPRGDSNDGGGLRDERESAGRDPCTFPSRGMRSRRRRSVRERQSSRSECGGGEAGVGPSTVPETLLIKRRESTRGFRGQPGGRMAGMGKLWG